LRETVLRAGFRYGGAQQLLQVHFIEQFGRKLLDE
jgi:hypothetical protein